MRTSTIGRAATFAGAARCYWLEIFPVARRELRQWRRRAAAIPEPGLRRDALLALQTKSGNAEGLAAYAVLARRRNRRAVVRAVIAYQTTLDYLDSLTERTSHPHADKLKLNGALEVAVDTELSLDTYREEIAQRADREYLAALLEACRSGLGRLPSYPSAREALGRRARLAAESQAMNHSLLLGAEEEEIAEWARGAAGASGLEGEGLRWWEVVAAGASTPALGALTALATQREATESDFLAVERVYFPWVNALNTLLDSLVDLDEDPALQRHIERYGSLEAAAERVAALATRARAGVSQLADAQRHELILAAMGGYYLAEPAAWVGERSEIGAAVLDSLGPFAHSSLFVHKLRRGTSVTALRPRRGRLGTEAIAR
jgi:tetraprenyl-beta-curcumene synthase